MRDENEYNDWEEQEAPAPKVYAVLCPYCGTIDERAKPFSRIFCGDHGIVGEWHVLGVI